MLEIHATMMNPLDTVFYEVRYKDPADNIWKLFYDYSFIEQYPYGADIFTPYHWHAYQKYIPLSFYLPLIYK